MRHHKALPAQTYHPQNLSHDLNFSCQSYPFGLRLYGRFHWLPKRKNLFLQEICSRISLPDWLAFRSPGCLVSAYILADILAYILSKVPSFIAMAWITDLNSSPSRSSKHHIQTFDSLTSSVRCLKSTSWQSGPHYFHTYPAPRFPILVTGTTDHPIN